MVGVDDVFFFFCFAFWKNLGKMREEEDDLPWRLRGHSGRHSADEENVSCLSKVYVM